MKILSERSRTVTSVFHPSKIKFKWQGVAYECDECGCSFQLEEKDEPKLMARIVEIDAGLLGLNLAMDYFVRCPVCGSSVDISTGCHIPSEEDYKQAGVNA